MFTFVIHLVCRFDAKDGLPSSRIVCALVIRRLLCVRPGRCCWALQCYVVGGERFACAVGNTRWSQTQMCNGAKCILKEEKVRVQKRKHGRKCFGSYERWGFLVIWFLPHRQGQQGSPSPRNIHQGVSQRGGGVRIKSPQIKCMVWPLFRRAHA